MGSFILLGNALAIWERLVILGVASSKAYIVLSYSASKAWFYIRNADISFISAYLLNTFSDIKPLCYCMNSLSKQGIC